MYTPVPGFFTDGTLADGGALMEVFHPRSRGFYFATLHERPLLYANLPRPRPPGRLLDYLLDGLYREDIFAAPRNWSCVASFYDVSHIVLYPDGRAETGQARQQIEARDFALLRVTPEALLYQVPPASTADTCLRLGAGWGPPRPFGPDQPLYRWLEGQHARLGLLRRAPGRAVLQFTAHAFAQPRTLRLSAGEHLVAEITVSTDPQPFALPLDLPAGVTWLDLRSVEPATSPADYGYAETVPVSVGLSQVQVVPGDTARRDKTSPLLHGAGEGTER